MPGTVAVHGLLFKYNKLDPTYELDSPSPTESGELAMLKEINSFILGVGKPVNIKIKRKIFKDIVGMNKVKGTPKADLVLVSFDAKKNKFKEVCFLSHKKGKTVKDFGQWSGMSDNAGKTISKNELVEDFIQNVKNSVKQTFENKKIKNTLTVAKIIPAENDLIKYSMYGPDYGKAYGINNVNFILQGNPTLTLTGKNYVLNMSGHIMENGEGTTDEIALMAYRKGAAADRQQFGVKARFVIQAKTSRPIHFMFNNKGILVEQ
jgi:hypothetical protein